MASAYQLSVIEQASFHRGAIITSYAQVEYLLGDIVMRCMVRPEYAFLGNLGSSRPGSRLAGAF